MLMGRHIERRYTYRRVKPGRNKIVRCMTTVPVWTRFPATNIFFFPFSCLTDSVRIMGFGRYGRYTIDISRVWYHSIVGGHRREILFFEHKTQ